MIFLTSLDGGYFPALARIVHASIVGSVDDATPYMEGIGDLLSVHAKIDRPADWIPPKLPGVMVRRAVSA